MLDHRRMNLYDLLEEFLHLQVLGMSKLRFMENYTREIKNETDELKK